MQFVFFENILLFLQLGDGEVFFGGDEELELFLYFLIVFLVILLVSNFDRFEEVECKEKILLEF